MMTPLPVLFLALSVFCCSGFYLPGVAPKEYETKEKVDLTVNKLDSVKTQLPFEYYSLPFCSPDVKEDAPENLGEVMSGDVMTKSPYELKMKVQQFCKVLCRKQLTKDQADKFQKLIEEEYHSNWIIDNLPGATRQYSVDDPTKFRYSSGFPVGISTKVDSQGGFYIYNHIRFTVKYHQDSSSFKGARVVGFELEPFTVKHVYETWEGKETNLATCNDAQHVDETMAPQPVEAGTEIVFTYDVKWEESEVKWASRWDVFFQDAGPDEQIHWFSIVNSVMIVLFLTGMVAMILIRALHKDIARYNEETVDDMNEETGWKLVHGDVFRPPQQGRLMLSVLVGSGIQILMMTLTLMVFAVLGFLSPSNRGGLMTAMLLLFVFMGSFAGYYSARMYKLFQGKQWKLNTLLTAALYPGFMFLTFFLLNLFVWGQGSSGAVPFGTLFALLVLWFGISVPLVFLGSYFGFKKPEYEMPLGFNQIPRQIPEQAWYMHPVFTVLMGGILPFGAVFIELFFIMSSVWLHQIYYVFGFLLLVVLILIATCSEIAIVMCYFQLCCEDYNWWWKAFLTSGSSALYLFLYSVLYFNTKLDMARFVSTLLYFGYMAAVSVSFFVLTGTIGFLACFYFVRKIYGSIKVE